MKVILREHVDHLGMRGEVVTVARGYARNYLLPKQKAWEATPGNLQQVQHQHKQWAVVEEREIETAQQAAAQLAELHLKTTRKAGESGTLYGSVTNGDIAELLAAEGIKVDRRKLVIASPIKTLGVFDIQLRLHPKLNGTFKVEVEAEGGRVADTATTLEEKPEVDEDAEDETPARSPEATEETPEA